MIPLNIAQRWQSQTRLLELKKPRISAQGEAWGSVDKGLYFDDGISHRGTCTLHLHQSL